MADEMEVGFAKLQGSDFEYYMQTYSIILGRSSKHMDVDVDLASLGGGMNISRRHARIFYDFARRRFALEVFGKNGCFVEGVLHEPGNPPVKLDSQDLLQMGDKKFYFLLPTRSIFAGEVGGVVGPTAASMLARNPRMDEEEEEEEEEEMVIGRNGKRGRVVGPIKKFVEKSSVGKPRADRDTDNLQLRQLEEKDVISCVATVLSDLCGPGEWMPMASLHSEFFFSFRSSLVNSMAMYGITAR